MRVSPHLNTEEEKIKCLDRACAGHDHPFPDQESPNTSKESQKQQETKQRSIEAALDYRIQVLMRHLKEAYAKLQLALDETKHRTSDSLPSYDDRHNTISQEFYDIVRLFIECCRLSRQHNQVPTDKSMGTVRATGDVVEASGGAGC